LAMVYLLRTIAIAVFLALPVTPGSTLAFAAAMGLLWLSVVPLVSGIIGRMFGLQHFNTLFGLTFFSHQIGAFIGASLGGVLFDMTGSYSTAWMSMIVVGLTATALQWSMDDRVRPGPGVAVAAAAQAA